MEKMFRIVVKEYAEAVREAFKWFIVWDENKNEANYSIWLEKRAERNAYEHLLKTYGFTDKQIWKMERAALEEV